MDVAALQALRTPAGAAALADAAAAGPLADRDLLAVVTALRERHDPALVSAAVAQAGLRARGRVKFGPDADRMLFTPAGLEQATRADVARHRARRFAAAEPGRLLDLCCGIGADLVAAARAGLRVHGVDRDPAAVAAAAANAAALGVADRVSVECGDVTDVPLAGWPAAYVDPARRAGGRRVFDPRAYSPPFDFLAALAAAVPLTGAKIGPGVPHELIPAGVEAEWVSVAGEVKEAALWWGALASAPRRATLLPPPGTGPAGPDSAGPAGPADPAGPAYRAGAGAAGAVTLTGTGTGRPPVGPPGEWLFEPDGAVIRAGLVAEVAADLPGGRLLDPTIAYLAADAAAATPFARGYRVTDVLPFSLARLRALFLARGVGVVTIKKRGSAVDPETFRRQLRLAGSDAATLVLTRVRGAPTAFVCQPLPT